MDVSLDEIVKLSVKEDGRVRMLVGDMVVTMPAASARDLRDRLTRAIIVAEVWHKENEEDAAE